MNIGWNMILLMNLGVSGFDTFMLRNIQLCLSVNGRGSKLRDTTGNIRKPFPDKSAWMFGQNDWILEKVVKDSPEIDSLCPDLSTRCWRNCNCPDVWWGHLKIVDPSFSLWWCLILNLNSQLCYQTTVWIKTHNFREMFFTFHFLRRHECLSCHINVLEHII